MNKEEYLQLKTLLEQWKQRMTFEKPEDYQVHKAYYINENDYELLCCIITAEGLIDVFRHSFSTSIDAYACCNEVDQYIQQCIANAESYKQNKAKTNYLDRFNELIK